MERPMTTSGMTYRDTDFGRTKPGLWRRLLSAWTNRSAGRETVPAPDEAEVDILLEDTIRGVTVRFTGTDDT